MDSGKKHQLSLHPTDAVELGKVSPPTASDYDGGVNFFRKDCTVNMRWRTVPGEPGSLHLILYIY